MAWTDRELHHSGLNRAFVLACLALLMYVHVMQRDDALLAMRRLWIRGRATQGHTAAKRLHDACCIVYGYLALGNTAAVLLLQMICYMGWSDNIANILDACCLLPYSRQMRLLAKVIACACWQGMTCTCTHAAVIHHWLKFCSTLRLHEIEGQAPGTMSPSAYLRDPQTLSCGEPCHCMIHPGMPHILTPKECTGN